MSNLSEKAMLIRNRVSFWDARKFDRKVSNEIADQKGADHSAGRYNKVLFAREAIRDLSRIKTAAKEYHNHVTLAWDKNLRLLPSSMYMEYMEKMQGFRLEMEAAARVLERDWDKWIEDAKSRLNGMFDERDYPHPTEMYSRFGIKTLVWPMPNSDDFRVSLSAKETARIKADMEKQLNEQLSQSMEELWHRIYEAVERMRDLLADENKTVTDNRYETSVNKLRSIVDVLPALNITGDPDMANMAKKLVKSIGVRDAGELREDKKLREREAQTAEDILASMAGYIGGGK